MRLLVGSLISGLVLAGAAQAQVLPPMRGPADAVRVSDFEGRGPYDSGPYAAMPPRVYAPSPRYGYVPAPSVLPPHEIYAILREAGFSPLGAPRQRGLVYTVSALDRHGEDGRMVIDARSGRILRFMPAYQMGDRMNAEVVTRYGPEAALPELPQYRRPPFNGSGTTGGAEPAPKEKLASRTPSVPLPKPPPVRAVATPAKPVAAEQPKIDKPVAEKPAEPVAAPVPAPVQQSAVTEPTPVENKAPETTGAAPVLAPAAQPAPPAVAPPAVEAKPDVPAPAGDRPPVQGLE